MAPTLTLPTFNPNRLRSYLLRLPLFTRGAIIAILIFWIVELQTVWSVTQWGALIPKEIGLGTRGYPPCDPSEGDMNCSTDFCCYV